METQQGLIDNHVAIQILGELADGKARAQENPGRDDDRQQIAQSRNQPDDVQAKEADDAVGEQEPHLAIVIDIPSQHVLDKASETAWIIGWLQEMTASDK